MHFNPGIAEMPRGGRTLKNKKREREKGKIRKGREGERDTLVESISVKLQHVGCLIVEGLGDSGEKFGENRLDKGASSQNQSSQVFQP